LGLERFLRTVVEDVDVVRIEDVDAVDAEPLERRLEGTHHAVIGVVVDFAARRRLEELADAGPFLGRAYLQEPADLGGKSIVVALLAAQKAVEARFGKAKAVERRRVEVTAARLPRGFQRGVRLLVGDGAVEVAQGCRAEAELGEGDAAIADAVEMPRLHVCLPDCPARDTSIAR